MAVEIELKAWAADPKTLAERVSGMAEYSGAFEKEDLYWYPEPPNSAFPSGIRIRRITWNQGGAPDSGKTAFQVTCKTKEVREGIEVNDEREFTVDDPAPLGELLRRMGFAPGIAKIKRGRAWKQGDLTAEITEVEGLGWFIELEILADNARPETVEAARGRLRGFLEKAGVGADRIESRYYTELLRTEMLREKGLSGRPVSG